MKVYKNMSGLDFIILSRLEKGRVLVKFLETGSVVESWSGNCAAGKVADPFQKSRLGVGYMGLYEKQPYHKAAHQLWSNMLKRCYDPNDKKGYYGKGVVVDPHWHCYANFLQDIKSLDGFQNWVNREGYDLDKDTLGDGKTYSRYTCKFIPSALNKSLGKKDKKKIDGEWVTTTL